MLCNLPSNIVAQIFGGIFHFQKLKQHFHGFKTNERTTLFQKPKKTTNYKNFLKILTTSPITTLFTTKSLPLL
jgi:hypothetical protein